MELPGGVWANGVLRRDFAFRAVTGELELAVADATGLPVVPRRVTAALTAALDHVGGEVPTWERVHARSVGDRQFLVRQLGAQLGQSEIWFTASCASCRAQFDFFVAQTELPVKPAGDEYPSATAETSFGPCRLRMPTGADQEAIGAIPSIRDSRRMLAASLIVAPESQRAGAVNLTEQDVQAIEAAVEAVAPEVTTRLQADCPECGHNNQIGHDPYACLDQGAGAIFAEVHRIASVYHWSEAEILALPRSRRHTYLRLLDQARGIAH